MRKEPGLLRRLVRGTLAFLGWAYAIVAILLIVGRFLSGDRFWPVLIATQVAHLWLAPALVVVPVALLLRARRLALACCVPLVVLGWDCVRWIPAGTASVSEQVPGLRVMSWNLGYSLADVGGVADEIRRMNPDLILLQEPSADAYEQLARWFGEEYPHHGLIPSPTSKIRGKAWFSRNAVDSSSLETSVAGGGVTNERGDLVLTFDGAPLYVSNIHTHTGLARLGRAWWSAPGHLALARLHVARSSGLVVGDYNTTERSPIYHDLRETGLVDAFRERGSGPGFTFPIAGRYRDVPLGPFLRIDYLWHTPDLECVHIEVGRAAGSDHLPLLGVFVRRPDASAPGREPR